MSDVFSAFYTKKTLKMSSFVSSAYFTRAIQKNAEKFASMYSAKFTPGTSIEYKYNDKHWKNGTVFAANSSEITISIYKNVDKQKKITMRRHDISKKTIRLSNIAYPEWIKTNTTVYVERSHSECLFPTKLSFEDK